MISPPPVITPVTLTTAPGNCPGAGEGSTCTDVTFSDVWPAAKARLSVEGLTSASPHCRSQLDEAQEPESREKLPGLYTKKQFRFEYREQSIQRYEFTVITELAGGALKSSTGVKTKLE